MNQKLCPASIRGVRVVNFNESVIRALPHLTAPHTVPSHRQNNDDDDDDADVANEQLSWFHNLEFFHELCSWVLMVLGRSIRSKKSASVPPCKSPTQRQVFSLYFPVYVNIQNGAKYVSIHARMYVCMCVCVCV